MKFRRFHLSTWAICMIGLASLNVIVYFYGCNLSHESDNILIKHGFLNVLPEHFLQTGNQEDNDVTDILTRAVPPTVHYFWCRKNYFEFQHYLSVLSTYKTLRPTEIIFHYLTHPMRDELGYYQYFDELLRDLPNFFVEPLQDVGVCEPEAKVALEGAERVLRDHGGVLIGINVVLSDKIVEHSMDTHTVRVPTESLIVEGGLITRPATGLRPLSINSTHRCATPSLFTSQSHDCVYIEGELFPFQIFDLQTDFGSLARLTGYGSVEPLTAQTRPELTPNSVHYVWLGNNPFTYFNYLSILSSLYIQNADSVFIHGDYEPMGLLWDKVKILPRVKYIYRECPHSIYGNRIESASHASDVMRFDILHRYGGIYVDWDLLWVNPLSVVQRQYDAVSSIDWPLSGKYPDTINMGIVLGKRGSKYFKYMMESFRYYIDGNFAFNGIHVPYKVYEHNPDSLHIDSRLQVICFYWRCHPTWVPGYQRGLYSLETLPSFDWKTGTNCVHWTRPDPFEFFNQHTLLSSKSEFAAIGVHILQKAGGI